MSDHTVQTRQASLWDNVNNWHTVQVSLWMLCFTSHFILRKVEKVDLSFLLFQISSETFFSPSASELRNERKETKNDPKRAISGGGWEHGGIVFYSASLHSFYRATMQKKKGVCISKKKKQHKSENKGREVQGLFASFTYTSPRTGWDHYKTVLCHCHPALINLCQGHTCTVHTATHAHASNLHSYCYI